MKQKANILRTCVLAAPQSVRLALEAEKRSWEAGAPRSLQGALAMTILPSPARKVAKADPQALRGASQETCPWCSQPISHDKFEEIRRRMTAAEQQRLTALTEQFARETAAAAEEAKSRLEEARTEAAAAAQEQVLAARSQADAATAASGVLSTKLTALQAPLDA